MKANIHFAIILCAAIAIVAVTGEAVGQVRPDVWITPNPPWNNVDISLSGTPTPGATVTITATIHNSGGVGAAADIKFEWGYIGSSTAPAYWNYIGTNFNVWIPRNGVTTTSMSWLVPAAAKGHSCVQVTIMQPTTPIESNATPANSAWENLWILTAIAGQQVMMTGPIINPEDAETDIFIEFNEVYLPVGWTVSISDDYFELVGPGETRDVTVYFSVPSSAVPGDSARANLEVYLSGRQHIGGTDIIAVVMSEEEIPTLTEWGLIIFGVVLLGFITWVFLKRRKAVAVSAVEPS